MKRIFPIFLLAIFSLFCVNFITPNLLFAQEEDARDNDPPEPELPLPPDDTDPPTPPEPPVEPPAEPPEPPAEPPEPPAEPPEPPVTPPKPPNCSCHIEDKGPGTCSCERRFDSAYKCECMPDSGFPIFRSDICFTGMNSCLEEGKPCQARAFIAECLQE